MDIRRDVCGVLVVGAPAAGINAIISAITIECLNHQISVIGFLEGWKHLRKGFCSATMPLTIDSVSSIHSMGGSLLNMSHTCLEDELQMDNTLRALRHLRVKFLVVIGSQIHTTFKLCRRARAVQFPIFICHVPISIFNDLYLPLDVRQIGYSSARDVGVWLVRNLKSDARTMVRWYVVTVIGSKSGHLVLGIAKSAAVTLALVPEQFPHGVTFEGLVNQIDATVIKRAAKGRNYGIILVSEGLIDKMAESEVNERFKNLDLGHRHLSQHIVDEMENRWKGREGDFYIKYRDIGPELRSAEPNPTDVEAGRDVGYAAVKSLLREDNANLTVLKGDNMATIPLTELIHTDNLKPRVRLVDVYSLSFTVSQKYMIRLEKEDLANRKLLSSMCKITGMNLEEFKAKYSPSRIYGKNPYEKTDGQRVRRTNAGTVY